MNFKYTILGLSFFAVIGLLFIAMPLPVKADCGATDIACQITALQAQVQTLLAKIATLQNQQTATPAFCYTFNTNLGYADSGTAEVKFLHTVLKKEGFSVSPDSDTQYTEVTGHAVVQFQAKYGITQTGYVGPLTRAKLNAIYGCNPIQDPIGEFTPFITLTSPSGGENWKPGETHTITWNTTGLTQNIDVMVNRKSTGTVVTFRVPVSSSSYSWTIPATTVPANDYYINVIGDFNGSYISSTQTFSITNASFTGDLLGVTKNTAFADQMITPNTSNVKIGSYILRNSSTTKTIRLMAVNIGLVTSGVDLSNFSALKTSDTSTGNGLTPVLPSGSNVFGVSDTLAPGTSVTIDIFANTMSATTGTIATNISVSSLNVDDNIISRSDTLNGQTLSLGTSSSATTQHSIILTSPNGGETYNFGPINVNWTSVGVTNAYIYLQFPDGGLCYLKSAPASQNSTSITINNGDQCSRISKTITAGKYKIFLVGDTETLKDISEDYFNIGISTTTSTQPSVTITSPNSGESWQTGSTHNIAWSSSGVNKISINIVRPGPIISIASNISASSGSYSWTIPTNFSLANNYYIQIIGDGSLISNGGNFSIISSTTTNPATSQQPSLTITSPSGGENWTIGSTHNITWTNMNMGSDTISMNLECNSGYQYTIFSRPIFSNRPASSGSFSWTTDNNLGTHTGCKISAYNTSGNYTASFSTPSTINITTNIQPSITITSPSGGETWKPGETHVITWTSTGLTQNIDIMVNRKSTGTVVTFRVPAYTHSYSWTIPSTIIPANDYYINAVGDFVAISANIDKTFTISASSTTGSGGFGSR